MHITHPLMPAVETLAVISLGIAGITLLTLLLVVIILRRIPNRLSTVASVMLMAFLFTILPAIGLGIIDNSQSADQLRAQTLTRYGVKLTGDQTTDLLSNQDKPNQTIRIDNHTATLYGTTNDRTKTISLVQLGGTYLLTGENLTELPRR